MTVQVKVAIQVILKVRRGAEVGCGDWGSDADGFCLLGLKIYARTPRRDYSLLSTRACAEQVVKAFVFLGVCHP